MELFEVEGDFAADDGVGIVEAGGEELEDVDGGVVDGLAVVLVEGEGVAEGHEAVVGDVALECGEESGVAGGVSEFGEVEGGFVLVAEWIGGVEEVQEGLMGSRWVAAEGEGHGGFDEDVVRGGGFGSVFGLGEEGFEVLGEGLVDGGVVGVGRGREVGGGEGLSWVRSR